MPYSENHKNNLSASQNPQGPSLLDNFASLVLKYRLFFIIFLVILTLPAVRYNLRMVVDNSLNVWFEQEDPDILIYNRFLERFEGDEYVVLGFKADDIFTKKNLEFIDTLTRRLEKLDRIINVTSLTNIEDIYSRGEDLIVEPLIKALPSNRKESRGIRLRALSNPLIVDNLLSRDGKTTVILGQVPLIEVSEKGILWDEIKQILLEYKEGYPEVHLAGTPIMDSAFDRASKRDNDTFIPLVLIMSFIMLFLLFRRLGAILLCIAVVVLSLLWTLGIFVFTGRTFNMVTAILPPLLLTMGVAGSVHILTHFNEEIYKGKDKIKALKDTIVTMFLPCFFTSLTTAVGLGSFLTSEVVPVKELGGFSALGITIAFLMIIAIIPSGLSLYKGTHMKMNRILESGLMTRFLMWEGRINDRYKKTIAWGSLIIIILSLAGIARLRTETTALLFFKEKSEVRKAYEFLEKNMGGISNIEIYMEGEKGIFKDVKVIKQINKIEQFVFNMPEIDKVTSYVDYLREITRALKGRKTGRSIDYGKDPELLPMSREEVAQYLLIFELSGGKEVDDFLNRDYNKARISIRVKAVSSERGKQIIDDVRKYITDLNSQGFPRAYITGMVPLALKIDSMLISGQLKSFTIATIIIYILMIIVLRSFRLGSVSMIPNLIPVGMTLGLMGWCDISLNVATIMIGGVAIGLAVDDTIHYCVRFRRELPYDWDYIKTMYRTHLSVGRAVVCTSSILFAGFSVLVFGSFKPTINFGILTGLCMLFALVGDLMILPILLYYFKPIKRSNIPYK